MDRRADLEAVIHSHSVAFFALDRTGKGPSSRSAGSGTLVDFGGIRGIATAAHVAADLVTMPEVGIMRFKPGRTYEALCCAGDQLEVVSVGAAPFGPKGPDLAFVRLPFDTEERLAATNAYFNSTERARLEAAGNERPDPDFFFVTGVISELSRSTGMLGNSSRMEHAAIIGVGHIGDVEIVEGFDLLDFRVFHHDGFPAPSSYEGLSGGGLWMIGEGEGLLSRTLVGLAYFQSNADVDGSRVVRCHGPLSLHENLYLAVLDRYLPDKAKEHRAAI